MREQRLQPVLTSFRELRESQPERHLFTWVDGRGCDDQTLTVGQLAESVDAIAASLRDWGLVPGDRVLLVYPPGLEFIKAFVGCLAAGVLPVPVYPPSPFQAGRDLSVFAGIAARTGARIALTDGSYDRVRRTSSVAGLFGRGTQGWPQLDWYRTDRRLRPRSTGFPWHIPSALDEVAFLQFTSGSTADPKGVMVTHGNLAHEIAANVVDLRLHEGTRGVFWLPQYHDMGLINVILSTVLGNSRTHLMSPLAFLQHPALWFDVMSRVGATVTSAPNFAYQLAVRKTTPEQRESWDLSALEMAICAAEPVRDRTVRAFLEAFKAAKLKPDVFFTAYGLAENTASASNRGQGQVRLHKEALARNEVVLVADDDPAATTYFGCGTSSKPGDRIQIVDPDTHTPCEPHQIGEIWIHSATTAAGYWGMPELTDQTFRATIAGEDSISYLRTGDLGFLHEDELYVTGRIKDMMIIRGRNVYPSDLEDSARDAHPLIRPGGVLAFSVGPGELRTDPDGADERVVVLVETKANRLSDHEAEEISTSVRRSIYADHQLACSLVVIGQVGLVHKTTSGKLRRQVCKRALLSGELAKGKTVFKISPLCTEEPGLYEWSRTDSP